MPPFHFPGHPAFLDAAAEALGRPSAARAARRDATLSAVAALCGQAAEAEARHVAGILAEAEALADRLRVALRAAELMLDHVRSGRSAHESGADAVPARRPRPASRPAPIRGGRDA